MDKDKKLVEKISKIKLLLLDVDGVLTEGSIVYSDKGGEIKSFNVQDGHGIKLLMRGGIDVGIITARESRVVATRARDLGITLLYQGSRDKRACFNKILDKEGLKPHETAFVGDDLVDIPVLTRAGFSASVPGGVPEVRDRVDYVTVAPGGRGAVREICELMLKARGLWDGLIAGYLE
ncbi:MAG: KdsC family phosphatase [Thermodesulfobacteriota bacterium]